jgi:hypothetical protein
MVSDSIGPTANHHFHQHKPWINERQTKIISNRKEQAKQLVDLSNKLVQHQQLAKCSKHSYQHMADACMIGCSNGWFVGC